MKQAANASPMMTVVFRRWDLRFDAMFMHSVRRQKSDSGVASAWGLMLGEEKPWPMCT